MNNNKIIKKIEKEKDRAYSKQLEKNIFLGEYKERVIAALTKEEVEEKGVYKEIIQALKTKEAKHLKISRDIEFSKIRDYVIEAEKMLFIDQENVIEYDDKNKIFIKGIKYE